MAILRTLITPEEVIEYGPEARTLPVSVVRKQIRKEENNFAINWLGWDFYTDLVNDSYDLATIDTWTESVSYASEAIVKCEGQLYKSKEGTNTTAPTDSTKWDAISKMKTSAYADLYEMFLREYLAYLVSGAAIEYSNQIGGKGLVEVNEDGIKTASLERQIKRERRSLSDSSRILSNMGYWILEQKNGKAVTSYDKALIIANCSKVVEVRQKARRIAFKGAPKYDKDVYLKSVLGGTTYKMITLEEPYTDHQSTVLTWTKNQGNLYSFFASGLVLVFQNGNNLNYGEHYTIQDVMDGNDTITIKDNTHYNGANYKITAISH